MKVKINTKEKFHVITIEEDNLAANMTEELCDLLLKHTDKSIPHVILNMKNVQTITKEAGESIAAAADQTQTRSDELGEPDGGEVHIPSGYRRPGVVISLRCNFDLVLENLGP